MLEWAPAQTHLLVADETGLPALERLLSLEPPLSQVPVQIRLLCSQNAIGSVSGFEGYSVEFRPDDQGFGEELLALLSDSPNATRLYVAGSESFLAFVRRVVRQSGFADGTITEELTGSGARKAQCVHCKTVYRDILYRVFDCPRCEVPLIVRDHYSRRIGAYQAVVLHMSDPNLPALRRERF